MTHSNTLTDVRGIEHLTNIQTLSLEQNALQKIPNLSPLQKLRTLRLSGNRITKIEHLEESNSLVELDLSGRISISGIQVLYHLKDETPENSYVINSLNPVPSLVDPQAHTRTNAIRDIEGLEALVNLETLDLSQNQIRRVTGLDTLQRLRILHLNRNPIRIFENSPIFSRIETFCMQHTHVPHIEIPIIVEEKNDPDMKTYWDELSVDLVHLRTYDHDVDRQLCVAIMDDDRARLATLLDQGANIHFQYGNISEFPLFLAAEWYRIEIVKDLIRLGADILQLPHSASDWLTSVAQSPAMMDVLLEAGWSGKIGDIVR